MNVYVYREGEKEKVYMYAPLVQYYGANQQRVGRKRRKFRTFGTYDAMCTVIYIKPFEHCLPSMFLS